MRILLVDDDAQSRRAIAKFLRSYLGQQVDEVESGDEGFRLYLSQFYPLVISDIRMPGMNGIELLKKIKDHSTGKESFIIMITGFGELKTAVEALRAGAYDYLQKPIDVDELAILVERIQETIKIKEQNKQLQKEIKEQKKIVETGKIKLTQYQTAYKEIFGLGKMGFFSETSRQLEQLANAFHQHRETSVLITGETGTGKEVFARMIHFQKNKELKPFITVNCSAITATLFESELFGYEAGAFTGARTKGQMGKLEMAQGGTIFLDEIGDMPLEMQPKLLRVLQMKEFYRIGGRKKIKLDVRFICASNRDLKSMIAEGSFRSDLFYRINAANLEIPSLKERANEILPLAQMFLLEAANAKSKRFRMISPKAEKILLKHTWPGNIRELKNVIERVTMLHDAIELKLEHLSFLSPFEHIAENGKFIHLNLLEDKYPYIQLEKDLMHKILKNFKGNKSKTATYLGITRNRLNRKL